MLIYKISDLIVFNALKSIKHGFLEIKKVNGEVLKFGNPDETLKVFLEIKDESLNYNLIKSGSIGLGESYMKDFFITNNLSDLIELTARNIKTIYKFSGIFDLPLINFFKNKFIKNTFYSIEVDLKEESHSETFKAKLVSYNNQTIAKGDDFGKFASGLKNDKLLLIDAESGCT